MIDPELLLKIGMHDDTDTRAMAYNEGYDAFEVGDDTNPYQPETAEYRYWQMGHDKAEEMADVDPEVVRMTAESVRAAVLENLRGQGILTDEDVAEMLTWPLEGEKGLAMSNLTDLIGRRPPTRQDWHKLADAWGVDSDYTLQGIAPAGVTCTTCWDWLICAECFNLYPLACPACNGTGKCHCQEDE